MLNIFKSGKGLRAQLIKGVMGGTLIRMASIPLQFLSGVLLARMLGPSDLGSYALIMALIQILSIGAQFGFPAFLVRSIAYNQAKNNYSETKGVIIVAWQVVLIASILIILIVSCALWFFEVEIFKVNIIIIVISFFLMFFIAMVRVISAAIRGFGSILAGQIPDQIIRPVILVTILLYFYFSGGDQFLVKYALLTYTIAAFFALAGAIWILLSLTPISVSRSIPVKHKKKWIGQSFPFLLLAGITIINSQTDIIMINMYLSHAQVGLYRIAIQTSDGLGVILFIISFTIAPQLARLHAENNWNKLRDVLVYSHRVGTLALLPAVFSIILFSNTLITLLFGESFKSASETLNILVLGKLLYATVGFTGLALGMLGMAKAAAKITLGTIALNIVLNIIFIPILGINGAALATVISQFVIALICTLYLIREFKCDFSIIGYIRGDTR